MNLMIVWTTHVVLSSKQIVDGRLFGPLNMWYFGVNCDIVFKCVAMNHLNEEVKGVKGKRWLAMADISCLAGKSG